MGRRRRALVLTVVGVTAVAAAAMMTMTRRAPAPPPDWSAVMVGRESTDSGTSMLLSPDGSTLVTLSETEALVEPRTGRGARWA